MSPGTRIAHAEPECLVDSRARHIDELGQVAAQRRVYFGHEHQAGGNGLALEICGLRQQKELGEVQTVHAAKGEQPRTTYPPPRFVLS